MGSVVTLSSNELLPGFIAFMDDFSGVTLVLGLARESELVFRL